LWGERWRALFSTNVKQNVNFHPQSPEETYVKWRLPADFTAIGERRSTASCSSNRTKADGEQDAIAKEPVFLQQLLGTLN
jgi:hypothetical protein